MINERLTQTFRDGEKPPPAMAAVVITESEATGRIALTENHIRLINERLDSMDDRIDDVTPAVVEGVRRLSADLNRR